MPVVLWWEDAPPLPAGLQGCGLDRGVYGPTNEGGDLGFGLGRGSYYLPPGGGPHTLFIGGLPSACLEGMGMLALTNHWHLDSGWTVPGSALAAAPPDVGFSPGSVVDELVIGGRRMWVIRAP